MRQCACVCWCMCALEDASIAEADIEQLKVIVICCCITLTRNVCVQQHHQMADNAGINGSHIEHKCSLKLSRHFGWAHSARCTCYGYWVIKLPNDIPIQFITSHIGASSHDDGCNIVAKTHRGI